MAVSTKRIEAEEKFLEESNSKTRERYKKEYLPLSALGLFLVELVPYEKKEQMIKGLKKLFEDDNAGSQPNFKIFGQPNFEICDMREEGILSGGGNYEIGTIINSDISGTVLGTREKLPKEFFYITVLVGQFVDFVYHVTFIIGLKDEYKTSGIEQKFIQFGDFIPNSKGKNGEKQRGYHSRSLDAEPVLMEYEKLAEEFLRPYSCGLFLKTNSKSKCPNFFVYSLPNIDFSNFQIWRNEHHNFLRFLGFDVIFCRFSNMLVAQDRQTLFPQKPNSVFQGLIFLASEDLYEGRDTQEKESEIIEELNFLGWEGLYSILTICYWSTFNIEITQSEFKKKTNQLINKIENSKKENNRDIYSLYDNVLKAYNDFTTYRLIETSNIKLFKEKMNHPDLKKFCTYSKALLKPEVNVFQDLYQGANYFLKTEEESLKEIQEEFDSLFQYCNNLVNMNLSKVNMKLQKSMNWMTVVMLVFTVATILVSLTPYYLQIWDFFKALFKL